MLFWVTVRMLQVNDIYIRNGERSDCNRDMAKNQPDKEQITKQYDQQIQGKRKGNLFDMEVFSLYLA